jgi:tetratricopeptide (TPR) repeat protein
LADVDQSQRVYPPIDPEREPFATPQVDAGRLVERVRADAARFARLQDDHIAASCEGCREPVRGWRSINALAEFDMLSRRFVQAGARLAEAARAGAPAGVLMNNRAVLAHTRGQDAEAVRLLEQAVSNDGVDATAWINLGLTRAALGDTVEALRAVVRGLEVATQADRSALGIETGGNDVYDAQSLARTLLQQPRLPAERAGALPVGRPLYWKR